MCRSAARERPPELPHLGETEAACRRGITIGCVSCRGKRAHVARDTVRSALRFQPPPGGKLQDAPLQMRLRSRMETPKANCPAGLVRRGSELHRLRRYSRCVRWGWTLDRSRSPRGFGLGLSHGGFNLFPFVVCGPGEETASVNESSKGVRVDVWLWAVRIFRTRTKATAACSAGKVAINGTTVKAAKIVHAGDHIRVRAGGRERRLEVVETPRKRVGAAVASEAMIDHSPPPPAKRSSPATTPNAQREPGAGRPTKRDRRQIDRFRGR